MTSKKSTPEPAKTLPKEVLEDIWQNKPHGYFKTNRTKILKNRPWKIKVNAWYRVYYKEDIIEVIASSEYDAKIEAEKQYREKYLRGVKVNAVETSVVF